MKALCDKVWINFWLFLFSFQIGAEGWGKGKTHEEIHNESLRRLFHWYLSRTPQEDVQPDNERVVMALVLLHGLGYRVYPLKGKWRAVAIEGGFDVVSV